jgi:hypothetical protein
MPSPRCPMFGTSFRAAGNYAAQARSANQAFRCRFNSTTSTVGTLIGDCLSAASTEMIMPFLRSSPARGSSSNTPKRRVGGTELEVFTATPERIECTTPSHTPDSLEGLTGVILEHKKVLEMRRLSRTRPSSASPACRPGEFASLPVCSGILRRCCDVLLTNSGISRPKASMKIMLSSLLTG